MIKQHPTQAVLRAFIQGDLDASIAIIVSSHIEMCEQCQKEVNQLTEIAAEKAFEQDIMDSFDPCTHQAFDSSLSKNMIDEIMSLPLDESMIEESGPSQEMYKDIEPAHSEQNQKIISHKNGHLPLPRALSSLDAAPWQGVGKVSRARFQFNDDERRLSLLKIDKGGQIPQHTHTGIEITLLLEGSFEDDMGTYQKGDFIWLDKAHTHSPITQDGCICLTLVSDALHFTQGFSKLLNPLGKLIY
jgi:putative transcriptional regulator